MLLSNLLVIQNGSISAQARDEVLSQLDNWNVYYQKSDKYELSSVRNRIIKNEVHFVLVEKEINNSTINDLKIIRKSHPLIHIIYYYSQLRDNEFVDLFNAGIDFCIIGDARQVNLLKTLKELWQNHWRRIPQDLLIQSDISQSVKVSSICSYIETTPIPNLTSNELAQHLRISESHFRMEFKKLFKINFREFKQKLFFYYESVLLFEKNLKPREVFDLLKYKNLSAFSRSFKARHGKSWQEIVRQSAN